MKANAGGHFIIRSDFETDLRALGFLRASSRCKGEKKRKETKCFQALRPENDAHMCIHLKNGMCLVCC